MRNLLAPPEQGCVKLQVCQLEGRRIRLLAGQPHGRIAFRDLARGRVQQLAGVVRQLGRVAEASELAQEVGALCDLREDAAAPLGRLQFGLDRLASRAQRLEVPLVDIERLL